MAKKFSDNAMVTANLAMSIRPTGELVRLDTDRVADRIKGREKDRLEAMILNGQDLAEVKACLPHGEFGAWLDNNFGWSPQHARRLMALGEYAKTNVGIRFDDGVIDGEAALILTSPSCPPKALSQVSDKVKKQEYVSTKYVRDLVKSLKPKKKKVVLTVDSEEESSPEQFLDVVLTLIDGAEKDVQRQVYEHLRAKFEPKRKVAKSSNGPGYTADFETFWAVFPSGRKSKKGDAFKAWRRAIKDTKPKVLVEAAEEYADSPKGQSSFVQGPSPWLNQRCWEDDRKAWEHDETTNGKPKRKVIRI